MGFSYNSKISGGIGTAGSAIAPGGLTAGRVALSYDADSVTDSADLTFNDTTNTLTTEAVSVRNVTATSLATPVITPPISPVLSLLTTVTVVAGASLVDGDYFTLSDGSAVVYEFDNDATVTPGRVGITFVGTETAQEIRDLVIVAINGSTLAATAIAAAADTLTVTSDTAGDTMGVNSENVADAGFLVPAWSEPTHATTYGYKVEACLADGSCAPSAEVQTTTGHATLSGANYNAITWGAVAGASYYKLTRVTGTPSGGDAPPRLLYTGPLLTFSDTNATSTSEAVATGNETGVVTAGATVLGKTTATKSILYTDSVRIPGQPVTVVQSVPDALPTILDLFPSTIDGALSPSAMGTGNTWIDLVDRDLNRSLNTTDWAAARIAMYAAGTRTGKGNVTIGAVASGAVDVPDLALVGSNIFVAPLAFFVGDGSFWWRTGSFSVDVPIKATQFKLSALNTAPANATDTGTAGEIRVTATAIYVCTATNTWVKADLATW